MGRYINGIYYPDPGEDPNNPSYPTGASGTSEIFPGSTGVWNWLNRPSTTQIELTPEEQSARAAMQRNASQPNGGSSFWDYLPSWAGGTAAPAVVTNDGEWSKISKLYDIPVGERIGLLQGITQSAGPVSGQGPNAIWRTPAGAPISEGTLLKLVELSRTGDKDAMGELARLSTPAKQTAVTPAYVYQAQAENYQASADLARAQMADIPLARQQATLTYISAEAARKFGQAAQVVGLQTQNRELALRGEGIAFDQSNAAAQAANRISELDLQQKNLQSQYEFNTSAANAAATNAVNQFNAQMGFNVEQANVDARQRRQEQLQSLARDIAEAAKSPGDYGKLAALTLANAGWGAENTAIGRGEDIRTEQSLAPTESLLRTRRDVLAEPTNPFSYTPIAPSLVTAPMVPTVDRRNFVIPKPTVTTETVQKEKRDGDVSLLGLPGQWNQDKAAALLQSGASSADVNAALNAAIAAQTGAPTGYQGEGAAPAAPAARAAAAEGGVVPRYDEGGVNMQDPMQAYQSGGANALYNALRSAGSSEQQAADFVNTVMRSDSALQQNTQAAQQAQAMQQAQAPMPQRPAYMPMTDSGNDTEAQLLRLGMSNPYMGGGYGTGGTYGQEDAMPAAAGWSPHIAPPSANYGGEGDAAPAASGWTPQVPDAFKQRKEKFDSDYSALKSGKISGDEFEKRNKDLDENQFLQLTRLYGIPAAGAATLAAGASVPAFIKWLLRGNQYDNTFSMPQAAYDLRYQPGYGESWNPQSAQYRFQVPQVDLRNEPGYASGGVANGAYISGERGPELNIPLGDKTIILNQKQMKAAGIDLKKLISDSVKPKQFAQGGVFDQGWGNVTDPDRTMSMQFLSDALAKARAGTPWQTGALPSPVYASSPGMSPIVSQTLGSLTAMAQGIPAEYFQELAAKYRPSGVRESVTQRSA